MSEECGGCELEATLFDAVVLGLSAGDEGGEILIGTAYRRQGLPEEKFAEDSERQSFERFEGSEGTCTRMTEFEATELFSYPGAGVLDRRRLGASERDETLQHFAVFFYLDE